MLKLIFPDWIMRGLRLDHIVYLPKPYIWRDGSYPFVLYEFYKHMKEKGHIE